MLLLGSLLSYAGKEYLFELYQKAISSLSAKQLLDLLIPSFFVNLLLIALALKLFRGRGREKITAFGVLWDQDQNAYCPNCEKPMADYDSYGMYEDEGCFLCRSCNGKFKLVDKRGTKVNLSSAVDSLENRGIGAIGISTLFFLVLVLLLAIWKFSQ